MWQLPTLNETNYIMKNNYFRRLPFSLSLGHRSVMRIKKMLLIGEMDKGQNI